MTDTKHTSQPWQYSIWFDNNNPYYALLSGDTLLGRMPSGDDNNTPYTISRPEASANIDLIAAAPELLEALRYVLDRLEATIERLPDTQENAAWEQDCIKDFEKARAAIAKAKGGAA